MALFIYPPISLSINSGPSAFVYDGANTNVTEDKSDPTNNRPMPSKMFIQKDGVTRPVNKDTGTPANTVAVPVEIVAASGTTINITAGDINIQTTSEGANFDSMRIGSGSGFYAEVTSNNDLSTFDSLSFTELVEINQQTMSIDLKTPNLGQALEAASVPVVLTAAQVAAITPPAPITGFATEDKQDDQIVILTDIETELSALNAKDFATQAKQDDIIASIDRVDSDLLTQTVTLTADLLLVARETTLTALSAKLPVTLGAKTGANSLSVVPATDAVYTITQQAPTIASTDQTQNANETTGATFTKPANAKNMVIFNNAGASVANRARIGQAPSWATPSGAILGVGNSTALLPAATFVAVAEDNSSNANLTVLWFY